VSTGNAGVLEIFVLGSVESRRIPLRWLVVRRSPHGKKSVVLTFGSGTGSGEHVAEWFGFADSGGGVA
jgi:hypothetical protein